MKKIIPVLVICMLVLSGLLVVAKNQEPPGATTEEYDMVIIAPTAFSTQIQPLIDHKNQYNVDTFLKTTEEIYDEYGGRDKPEQIKYFIKDALETYNISYVFLIGGKKTQLFKWHVPVRYVKLDDGSSYTEYISDLYYADIYKNGDEFEDWDSNGDDVFAEWGHDILDLEPDVYIGRLACRNRFDVQIMVNKIITYETTAYDSSWFKRMVLVGGDTFVDYTDPFPYEGEETCEIAAQYMDDFEKIRLYVSHGNLSGPQDVTDAINQGCGFLMTRCRGGTDRIRTSDLNGTEFIVYHNKNIKQMKNKQMYPIFILSECWHGKFDVALSNFLYLLQNTPNIYRSDCIPWCIAWWMVKKYTGGGIATITNTNTCYGYPGDSLNNNGIIDDAEIFGGFLSVEIFRLYGQEGINILGELHGRSVIEYVTSFPVNTNQIHCKSVQEWILLGDPSLKVGGYE